MLDRVLLDFGAPVLAKIIGQRFGKDAGDIAQIGIEALAEAFGIEPTREAVEAAVKPNQTTVQRKVMEAEARMPDLLLARAELLRAGNDQQRLTNELLLSAQNTKPGWAWAWLYVWQWFLMAVWGWTLIGVHLANAGLRLAGDAQGLPVPPIAELLTLTGAYLGLHMGGHTVLEMMRGKWGRSEEKWIE